MDKQPQFDLTPSSEFSSNYDYVPGYIGHE